MWSVAGPVAAAVATTFAVVVGVVGSGRPPPTPPLHDDDGSADDDDDDRNDDDDDDATMVATTAVSPSSGGAPPRRMGRRWVRGIEAAPTLAAKPRGDERSSETWSRFIDRDALLRGCLMYCKRSVRHFGSTGSSYYTV